MKRTIPIWAALAAPLLLAAPARAGEPPSVPALPPAAPAVPSGAAVAPSSAAPAGESPGSAPKPASAPQDVTIEEVLRLLRQKSPRAAAQQAAVDVAKAEVAVAGTYPNPRLGYFTYGGLVQSDYVNGSQHQLTLDVPLLVGGQVGARRAAAEAGVGAAQAQVTAARADLATQARILFVGLLAQQERVRVAKETLADVQRAKVVVEGRSQSGTMSAYDLLRVETDAQAKVAEVAQAEADEEDAARRLAVLLGQPGWRPRAVGAFKPAAALPAPASPPAVEAAKKDQQAAVARVGVAEREWLPTPVVSLGAFATTAGFGLAGYVGLSLDLPIANQGQGAVARANAEARAADLSRSATEAEAGAELSRAQRALEARRKALEGYQQTVAAKGPALRQMAEDAYKLGQGGVLDLLDTLRTLGEIRAAQVEYTERVLLAEIDVLSASGKVEPGSAP